MGSYGGGCIALDNANKRGIIDALSSTVVQFAEIRNQETGEPKAYVRIFMVENESDDSPVMLLDVIHMKGFSGTKVSNDQEKQERQHVLDLVSQFAKEYGHSVVGKEIPIYTGLKYNYLLTGEEEKLEEKVKIIGTTHDGKYYVNSYLYIGNSEAWADLSKNYTTKFAILS